MTKKTLIWPVAVLACSLLLAGLLLVGPFPTASALDANALVTNALVTNGYAIPRHVIGGGGQRAAGGDCILNGTVGEPIASGFTQGTAYGRISGFWWPGGGCRIYLPLVLR